MRYFCAILLMVVTMSSGVSALAQVVEDTRIVNDNSGPPQSGSFALTIFQDPVIDNPTSIFGKIDVSGDFATLFFLDANVDEGSQWYTAEHDDVFTAQTIANGDFFPLFDFLNPVELQVTVGESFLLGANTAPPSYGGDPDRDIFGWAELLVTRDGVLLVEDNAVAYGFDGIIIGKNQAVPEPSACLVLFMGLGMCLRRKRS